MIYVLNNLTSNYTMDVSKLEDRVGASNEPLEIEDMWDTLCLTFKRMADGANASESDGEETTLATGQFKGSCNKCGKYGHKSADCQNKGKWWLLTATITRSQAINRPTAGRRKRARVPTMKPKWFLSHPKKKIFWMIYYYHSKRWKEWGLRIGPHGHWRGGSSRKGASWNIRVLHRLWRSNRPKRTTTHIHCKRRGRERQLQIMTHHENHEAFSGTSCLREENETKEFGVLGQCPPIQACRHRNNYSVRGLKEYNHLD